MFWGRLQGLLAKRDVELCRAVGKLGFAMSQKMATFPTDADFLASVLVFLYKAETGFPEAEWLVRFLGSCCKLQEVLAFLSHRHFGDYLEQLPWRYRSENKVADLLDFCATAAYQSYGKAINLSL
jgi:hypothetical protein